MADINILMALAAAHAAGEPAALTVLDEPATETALDEPTAWAVLRVETRLVMVCLPSVMTVLKVRLGNAYPTCGD